MPSPRRALILALLVFFALPSLAHAAGVQPGFDPSSPAGAPFPSNRWTTFDFSQRTGLRVNLPKPDCAVRPSDCADIDVLNTLDGFNMQPRISIPFTGPIDPASVNSSNVFLLSVPDLKVTGINQITWEVAANTLHVESDQLLRQDTTYILVVTTGIRDAAGDRIGPASTGSLVDNPAAVVRGLYLRDVAVTSVFTTQTATSLLEQVRRQIKASTPDSADFVLGTGGERTVFPLAGVTSILFSAQTGTAPSFTGQPTGTPFLAGVGAVAFGAFDSPDYENASKVIPPVGSRFGAPAVQGTNRLYFNLFLPAGPEPAGGWPVAIYGHGFTDSKNGSPFVVAGSMARRGIATIAINVVGHGFGPLGTLIVNRTADGPVVLPAGGRGIDQDGNGAIGSTEGVSAAPPQTLISSRDGLRQTVIDLMQLTREIQAGMDVDGDGTRDLDPLRISYFGQSFGGIYGTKFLAVEPDVHVGVTNVAGGSIIEVARLGAFRPLVALSLATRIPPLLNGGVFGFTENMPLRNLPPLIDTVPGASAIQRVLEWSEWASQPGNPVAYAVHLRAQPLPGVPAKSVILQFARGDQTVPNPTTSAIIRAGALQDRTTVFRNDLAFAADPTFPKNPHTFLTRLPGLTTSAGAAAVALAAQDQIAQFVASNGTVTVDPDGAGPLFETPLSVPPWEDLGFIP